MKQKIAIQFCFFMSLLILSFFSTASNRAYAGCGCTGCPPPDCSAAQSFIETTHSSVTRPIITSHVSTEMAAQKLWMADTLFAQIMLPAYQLMTKQLTTVAYQQSMLKGQMMDAQSQMETQREFQNLQAEAHRDYMPSQSFCSFGTNVRSMAESENISDFTAIALSQASLARQLGNQNVGAAESRDEDKESRWQQFVTTYCNPNDNNFVGGSTGLVLACGAGGPPERRNRDINYTALIEEPRTLDIFFEDPGPPSPDKEDVLAMSRNLFGHDVLSRQLTDSRLVTEANQYLYMALRSVAAKRSVAEYSFNSIVGLKAAGSLGGTPEYLRAIYAELGMSEADINEMLGTNPSYYAQLEALAKKTYQSDTFFANLYDKPANVARTIAGMKAIELMLDRAIYESQLRQEMALSVLLVANSEDEFRNINKDLSSMIRASN